MPLSGWLRYKQIGVGLYMVAITDAQNFSEKLQALAIIKLEESSQWALSNNYHWLLHDAEVTHIFNTNSNWKSAELELISFTEFFFFTNNSRWDTVWCVLVTYSTSQFWEWAVSFENVNLLKMLFIGLFSVFMMANISLCFEFVRMGKCFLCKWDIVSFTFQTRSYCHTPASSATPCQQ